MILKHMFKPLDIAILHNNCTHTCTLRCIVYTLPFNVLFNFFYKGVFYKKADLTQLLPLRKVSYILETIVLAIVLLCSDESLLTILSAGFQT